MGRQGGRIGRREDKVDKGVRNWKEKWRSDRRGEG